MPRALTPTSHQAAGARRDHYQPPASFPPIIGSSGKSVHLQVAAATMMEREQAKSSLMAAFISPAGAESFSSAWAAAKPGTPSIGEPSCSRKRALRSAQIDEVRC